MLSWQICGSRSQTRSAVDVHRFRKILMLRTLDHYLLANIAKRIRDRTRRYVASEHMTHVFSGRSVSCHISEVPGGIIDLSIERFVRALYFPLVILSFKNLYLTFRY